MKPNDDLSFRNSDKGAHRSQVLRPCHPLDAENIMQHNFTLDLLCFVNKPFDERGKAASAVR